ncbi:unnamed protein product [Alternaria alternata]
MAHKVSDKDVPTGNDDSGTNPTPAVDDNLFAKIPQTGDYRIYSSANKPTLILSVMDESFPSFTMDFDHSLSMYTENLTLQRSIRTSGHDLEIYTHSMTIVPSQDGSAYYIDSSGPGGDPVPPTAIVEKPKNGIDGSPGGNVRFVVEDIGVDHAILNTIIMDAHGGLGSDGQSSQNFAVGGNGGNGAGAGDVEVLVGNAYTIILAKLGAIYKAVSATPLKREALSDLNKVVAAIRSNKQFMSLEDLAPRLSTVETTLRADNLKDNLKELQAAVQELALRFLKEGDIIVGSMAPHVQVHGGAYGAGGEGKSRRGSNGTPGHDGTFNIYFNGADSAWLRSSTTVPAHPDQCRMLLEKAKSRYFLDDLNSTMECRLLLVRLQNRLFFIHKIRPDGILYKTYANAESRLHILPSSNPKFLDLGAGQDATANRFSETASIASLRQILAEADGLITQIDSGIDYYGNAANYAPMLSYNTYNTLTQALLTAAQDAETIYLKYVAENTAQSDRTACLQDMQRKCIQAIQDCEDTITILMKDIKDAAKTVQSLTPPLKDARTGLHKKIEEEKNKISKSFNLFHMSFSEIVDAVSMVMFCPSAPMAAVQTAGVLWKAGTNVPDDKDTLINKTYIVNQISQIEATTDALSEGLKARDDGLGVAIDDPGASKLIAARESMMKLLQQYSSVLGLNDLNEMEKTFNNYISLVDQRNTAVLHYNASLNLWYTNQKQKVYYQTQRDTLSDTVIKTIDPSLPAVTIFMEKAYTDSVATVMHALYRTQRSYRFTALTADSPLSKSLQGSPITQIRHADLVRANANILKAYWDAMDASGSEPQEFHGLVYPLPHAEWETVQDTMATYLNIPSVTSDLSESTSPFAKMANVRLTRVRLFVPGAKTASGMLRVALTHNGTETIVDTTDAPYSFFHSPISRTFKYRLTDGAFDSSVDGAVDGVIGVRKAAKTEDAFTLVGPFTTWYISLVGNDGLDLSQASSAYLKFDGSFFPFPS